MDFSFPVATTTTSLAELLTGWRQARRWSQRMLAIRSGLNNATLSRWEAGRAIPRLFELRVVLEALQVTPEQHQQALKAWQMVEGRAPASVDKYVPRTYIPTRPTVPAPAIVQNGIVRSPITGDLLWALRQRQGFTQSDVAQAVGVRQSTIARWENGETTPETQQLQALCYFLRPTQAELSTLSAGYFSLAPGNTQENARAVMDRTARTPLGDSLYDLQTLSCFEAHQQLPWYQTLDTTTDFFFACYIYARDLGYLGRFQEARHYLARAEAVFPLFADTVSAARRRYCQEIRVALSALLVSEQSIYGSGTSYTQGTQITLNRQRCIPAHRYASAAKKLRPLLSEILDTEIRSWLLMHLARYAYGANDAAKALEYAEQSWRILTQDWLQINQHPPSVQRRILHTRLLIRTDQWQEASCLLPTVEEQAQAWYTVPGEVNYALTLQAWAEVHQASGDASRAAQHFARANLAAPSFMKTCVN